MEIIIIAVLVILSAFFSSAETAFSTANRIRLKNLANDGSKSAKRALKITDNFEKTLTTILVGNNIVNISASSYCAVIFTNLFGNAGVGIATGIMTFLILIFGEILPKSYAKEHAEKVSMWFSAPLSTFMILITPISFVMLKLQNAFVKKQDKPTVTQDELKVIIDEISEEGVLMEHESEMVRSALDFNETMVKEILTPRVDMVAIDVADPREEMTQIIIDSHFSRIPVFKENLDNIKGIVHKSEYFQCLLQNPDFRIYDILTEPLYVPDTAKLSAVLKQLKAEHIHIAMVVDEYGGIAGLVTLEDILEELVGEIWDESDIEEKAIEPISGGAYRIKGDTPIEDVYELFGMKFDEEIESHSLGGWVFEKLGKIPTKNESFETDGVIYKVLKMDDNRIETVIARPASE